ncbi:ATP-binding cassette domain-containing protein, partial [Acidobacteria bacterium AH-259-D05]|nr:ATP-binding cassette domain-containing protein [Acidobacteria bacterium AH-259-D05]
MAYDSVVALDSVDLEIQPGEAVGFVGLSGAGKTTLFRLLNGMVKPTGGVVHVDGRSLSELSLEELRQIRSRIGFVHQDLSLIPNLRVLHNVLAGRLGSLSLLKGARTLLFPPRSYVNEIYDILNRVGIPEKLYERTDRLSGGQRQRVAIARALFQQPKGLLADEPVSSVDPARARSAVALLTEISREQGLTLCVSLHNLRLAREFFPRLVGLRGGRVVFDRATEAV